MTSDSAWITAKIAAISDLSHDIREFSIAPEHAMPAGAPGAHIALQVAAPQGTMVRTYSLLGGGDGAPYRIAVKRLARGRGGSSALWRMAPGEKLCISEPRNTFPLRPDAEFCLLIAGGIGITAVAGMARALAESGRAFELLYAVKDRRDLALKDELLQIAGDRLSIFVSADGSRLDFRRQFARLAPGAEAYVCGPPGMMMAARAAWLDSGRPMVGLRFETFGAGGASVNQDFKVSIPRLDRHITVSAGETLLEALEQAGIAMISGCRKGECGLCALTVLSTDYPIEHRDFFYSTAERDAGTKLCTCVSRTPGGTLVLDTADRLPPNQMAHAK